MRITLRDDSRRVAARASERRWNFRFAVGVHGSHGHLVITHATPEFSCLSDKTSHPICLTYSRASAQLPPAGSHDLWANGP